MELAVCSDTHIPSRASAIPDRFRDRIRRADLVVHAGDFDSSAALAEVEGLASDLVAVAGNTDPDLGLPDVETVRVGDVRLAVTHNDGPPRTYEQRLVDTAREHGADVVAGGHSHDLLDETRAGVRLLNPGSATGAWPAGRATMLTARPADGRLEVTVHEA